MLVLDEQLLGRNLETALARWYRGPVLFITDLRPDTIIKDEAIPLLLRQTRGATFLTINETDFWRKMSLERRYCVVCFALSDAQAGEISDRLRVVFQLPLFQTKARRMGKMLRVTQSAVSYYSYHHRQVQVVSL